MPAESPHSAIAPTPLEGNARRSLPSHCLMVAAVQFPSRVPAIREECNLTLSMTIKRRENGRRNLKKKI